MKCIPRRLMALCAAALLLAVPACGESRAPANDLAQLARAYIKFENDKIETAGPSPGPASAEEFLDWAVKTNDPARKVIEDAVRGEWVVYYGTRRIDRMVGEGSNTIVLAYHKDTPTKGGLVGMADTSVRTMTAEEFAAASKATDVLFEQGREVLPDLLTVYLSYVKDNGKPPMSRAALSEYAEKMRSGHLGLKGNPFLIIERPEWTVRYGTPYDPDGNGGPRTSPKTIMAHSPVGGPKVIVIRANAVVEQLTVADFNEALKVK